MHNKHYNIHLSQYNHKNPNTSKYRQISFSDKPEVVSAVSSPYRVTEGQTAILVCTVIAANPITTLTWKWIKADSPNVELHNGPNYTIPNIQRRASGSYICTASNTVGTSDGVNITIDVQCMYGQIIFSTKQSFFSQIKPVFIIFFVLLIRRSFIN